MQLGYYLKKKAWATNNKWCWVNVPNKNSHMHVYHFEDPKLRVELFQLEDYQWKYRIVKRLVPKTIVFYESEPLGRNTYEGKIGVFKRQALLGFLFWYYGFSDINIDIYERVKDI